jgi:DNA-binding SARP family transcriptional activator
VHGWSRKFPGASDTGAAESPPAPAEDPYPWPDDSHLQIRCFGRFEVRCDGVLVQRWRRRASVTLLKYLVAQRRPIHRDVLLDLLWPDQTPEAGMNGLRVILHSLRRALAVSGNGTAADPVVNVGAIYYLNPAAAVWVDADTFTTHFDAGLRLERQARVADAHREYCAAEELYRDDFLVEDLYEEWTVLRREELRDQYLLVLTKIAQHCLATGDPEGCIVRCHKLLEKEPCNEDAYQRLMRAYGMLGQYRRVAHWYDVCERTLKRELDVSPSAETTRLYREIGAAGPRS